MIFVHNDAYPGPDYGPFADMEKKNEKYLIHQLKVIEAWKKEINDLETGTKFKVFEGTDIDYSDGDGKAVEGPTKKFITPSWLRICSKIRKMAGRRSYCRR